MDHFRTINSQQEITTILHHTSHSELGVIWQTCLGNRTVWPLMGIQVHEENIFMDTRKKIVINQSFPIYVKIHHRSMAFKLNLGEYDFLGTQLIAKIPKEAKAVEGRESARTLLPKKLAVFLTLRSLGISSMIDTKIQLTDLSEKGIGAAISKINQEFFQRNSFFQIVKIGERAQIEPNILTLRHISDAGLSKKLKVGFSLDGVLGDSFFSTLREEMKRSALN